MYKIITRGKKVLILKDRLMNELALQRIKDLNYCYKEGIIERPKRISQVKSESSIKKTRNAIRRVLECNLDNNSFFLTLTFKENLQDYNKANNLFKMWVRDNGDDLKYLNVKELQERGAIHFHCIIFDYKKNIIDLVNTWKHGFTFCKHIKNPYSWSISNYFTKYFGKENQLVAANKRIFSTSKNLKKESVYNSMIYEYLIYKYNYDVDLQKEFNQAMIEDIDLVDLAIYTFGVDKVKIQ